MVSSTREHSNDFLRQNMPPRPFGLLSEGAAIQAGDIKLVYHLGRGWQPVDNEEIGCDAPGRELVAYARVVPPAGYVLVDDTDEEITPAWLFWSGSQGQWLPVGHQTDADAQEGPVNAVVDADYFAKPCDPDDPRVRAAPKNTRSLHVGEELRRGDLFIDQDHLNWQRIPDTAKGVPVVESSEQTGFVRYCREVSENWTIWWVDRFRRPSQRAWQASGNYGDPFPSVMVATSLIKHRSQVTKTYPCGLICDKNTQQVLRALDLPEPPPWGQANIGKTALEDPVPDIPDYEAVVSALCKDIKGSLDTLEQTIQHLLTDLRSDR